MNTFFSSDLNKNIFAQDNIKYISSQNHWK